MRGAQGRLSKRERERDESRHRNHNVYPLCSATFYQRTASCRLRACCISCSLASSDNFARAANGNKSSVVVYSVTAKKHPAMLRERARLKAGWCLLPVARGATREGCSAKRAFLAKGRMFLAKKQLSSSFKYNAFTVGCTGGSNWASC